MMNRLWVRLSVAFLVVAWLAIGAVALIVNTTTEHSFRQYLNQRDSSFFDDEAIARLEAYYTDNGSWEGVEALLPGPKGGSGETGQGQGRGRGGGGAGAQVLLADASGLVVAATDPDRIGETLDEDTLGRAITLSAEGELAGWLVQDTPGAQALGEAERAFLDETTRALVLAALGASLLAIVVGGLLSWQLARPMRELTHATHDLAKGNLGRQVRTGGTAELTELAQAFNRMSRDLAEGERTRQRMAADIAHELRTPVSVLRGHLEAMLDGVFPLDPEHLAIAYDRTIHLSRLVDDLRLLTRAEAGQLPLERTRIGTGILATRAIKSFMPLALDAEITLEHYVAPDLPELDVDVDRIQQVLGNLLTNALRHTPPHGQITVTVTRANDAVRFAIANTGDTLTPEQVVHIFTPFWRAEQARERDRGGSGLGLAISRQLLALHGGRIWVESGAGQTTFIFELPAATSG